MYNYNVTKTLRSLKCFACQLRAVRVLLLLLVLTNISVNAQTSLLAVEGRLVHENGEPAIATIQVKGTKKIIYTNVKGEFTLHSVAPDAILLISGVNLQPTEIKINGRSKLGTLLVKLKVLEGETVVVEATTGYQAIPKERATGSFDFIDNKTLNQQVGTNILKRLEGVASGVLFDNNRLMKGQMKNDNITIRGLSTINASTVPLVVVDGFIYEGNINNINPNDVENMTILKDAAATSIWGARAGNGVIVITTRKGKFNQRPQVGFSAGLIVNQKPDLAYLPRISSSDYIDMEQFLFNRGYFNDAISVPYLPLTPAVEVFLKRQNGLIMPADSARQIDMLKAVNTSDQYKKYVYRNAVTQQYAINLRGGNNSNAYTFSAAYDKNAGELQDQFNKLNLKVDNIYKPVKDVQLSLGLYYTGSKAVSGMQPYNSITIGQRQVPYLSLADNNGNPVPVASGYRTSYTDTAGGGKLLNWSYYPLQDYKHDLTTTNLDELFGNIGLSYNFKKYLSVDVKYQYQQQQTKAEQQSDLESLTARNIINLFSQINPSTGTVTNIIPMGSIRNRYIATIQSHTARGQLNFNNNWGNHSASAIAGAELRQAQTSSDNNMIYGYNADPITYRAVDFVNYYPTYVDGSYMTIPNSFSFSNTVNRFASFYGNASYTYKKRYIFSASGRKDGSNIFGAATNEKWKPLWSVGAAWKISDENFYKSSVLPSLKLRATYGYSGNVDLSKTAEAVARYITGAPATNFTYTRIRSINNPQLRWERTGMLNIAVDFALKNDWLSGSIEYYHKTGNDLYGRTSYDYTTWGASPLVIKNVASITGNGVDLILNSRNIDRGLKWNTNLLLNYNSSKTTRYGDAAAKNINSLLGGGTLIIPQIGKPLYAVAAYKWGGLDAVGNPQGFVNGQKSTDYNAIFREGVVKGTNGSIVYLGPSSPTVFGSIINSFSWKNFSVAINVSCKFGYYFQKLALSYHSLINYGVGSKDYAKRWQKPGDELSTSVPGFNYPIGGGRDNFYGNSEVNVLKADHIRLQYINLAYAVNNKANSRNFPFSDFQVYLNAANLGIIWKANREGLDPDYPSSLRPEKTIAFGIRAGF